MRATTVRFSEELWSLLEEEARRQGVSSAQFIRDATVMRAALEAERRQDQDASASIARLAPGGRGRTRASATDAGPLAAVKDPARLDAVRALDGIPAAAFDRLTAVAARVLNAPIATVTLVESDRQVWKSQVGVAEPWASAGGTPLSHSVCQHAVANRVPLVVSDAREHPVLRGNKAVDDLGVIGYLGVPLISGEGHALGTLCVIDNGSPRHWTPDQVELLEDLGAAVLMIIERFTDTATLSEVKATGFKEFQDDG